MFKTLVHISISKHKTQNMNSQLLNKVLFTKWETERPDYNKICRDGILVQSEWDKSNPKILFLLKETYEHFDIIEGECGPSGTSRTFWRRMRMWTYVITEIYNDRVPTFERAMLIKEEPNKDIAYVNIKKNAQKREYNSEPNSVDSDIRRYAVRDKEFLQRQIEIINPSVVLCCSTFKFCDIIFNNIRSVSDKLYNSNGIWIIDFGHPSQTYYSYRDNFDALNRILKGIEK